MEDESGSRSRHNSSRSRHGSGRARHGSGDIWKRLEKEGSTKLKGDRDSPLLIAKGRVNGVNVGLDDDERVALITGLVENGPGDSPETCNGHCIGRCGEAECASKNERQSMPGNAQSPRKRPLSGVQEDSRNGDHPRDVPAVSMNGGGGSSNGTDAVNGNKKSSDSEGDSDNHGNGAGTDGDDDKQLLIRTRSGGGSRSSHPTSPHWKARSRHNSTEGLRKRTRSRSDSESSEAVSTTVAQDSSGTSPSVSGGRSPARPASILSTGSSRRRRPHSKSVSEDGEDRKEHRRGSHGSALHSGVSPAVTSSSRHRHRSMDSAGLEASDGSVKLQPLLDNPSFILKPPEDPGVKVNGASGNRQTSPAHVSPVRRAVSVPTEDGATLTSPGTDETRMLIGDAAPADSSNITKPNPKTSPRLRLSLKLSQVCRPGDQSDPPLNVISQEPSFSPQLSHKEANDVLNGGRHQLSASLASSVDPAGTERPRNGTIWHLQALPENKPQANGHIPNGKEMAPGGGGGGDAEVDVVKSPTAGSVSGSGESAQIYGATKCQAMTTLLILLLANLINYMDRTTIAGVLRDIRAYYNIDRSKAGLLQTAFICSYMIFSPIFGYLGDRYNRKFIMAIGIFCWSSITFIGSFIPADQYWLFLAMRALVGVGEASYSTIAPTIIADLFVKDMRTKALAVFYFAIPVGSGLGYIIGSNVATLLNGWQWSLRVTPALGVICVLCIIFLVREPPRGAAEGGTHLGNTTVTADLKYLMRNKSFMLSTLGFTCVAFVAGALSFWAPIFIYGSVRVQGDIKTENTIGLYFGVITCAAGFLGVGIGSETARRLRPRTMRADPLVCAIGLISSAPFLFLTIVFSKYNTIATWILIFVGETLLCLNWAIVTDIVLYIVIPTRRSMAEAAQILISHLFGDAGSPYLIGLVADTIKSGMTDRSPIAADFISLQLSLYMCCFVCVIGGALFLATAVFVVEDRARAEKAIRETKAYMQNGSTAVPGDPDNDEDSDDAMITVGGRLAINGPSDPRVVA